MQLSSTYFVKINFSNDWACESKYHKPITNGGIVLLLLVPADLPQFYFETSPFVRALLIIKTNLYFGTWTPDWVGVLFPLECLNYFKSKLLIRIQAKHWSLLLYKVCLHADKLASNLSGKKSLIAN